MKWALNIKMKIFNDFLEGRKNHNQFLAIFPRHKRRASNNWLNYLKLHSLSIPTIHGHNQKTSRVIFSNTEH